jgi:hypothetical protein
MTQECPLHLSLLAVVQSLLDDGACALMRCTPVASPLPASATA